MYPLRSLSSLAFETEPCPIATPPPAMTFGPPAMTLASFPIATASLASACASYPIATEFSYIVFDIYLIVAFFCSAALSLSNSAFVINLPLYSYLSSYVFNNSSYLFFNSPNSATFSWIPFFTAKSYFCLTSLSSLLILLYEALSIIPSPVFALKPMATELSPDLAFGPIAIELLPFAPSLS